MMSHRHTVVLLSIFFLVGIFGQPTAAQDNRIAISVTVPSFSQDTYKTVIARFEQENPDIRVHIVPIDVFDDPMNPDDQVNKYLQDAEAYLQRADVVFLASHQVSSELIRAGFLLDISPLVSTDTTINSSDFPESVWQSYQWDGGFWIMPMTVGTYLLQYDRSVFDQLGLPYPNENWTITDLQYVTQSLLQIENNEVVRPGLPLYGEEEAVLLRSLLTEPLFDPLAFPSQPRFSSLPELEPLLMMWQTLKQSRVFEYPSDSGNADPFANPIPLTPVNTHYGLYASPAMAYAPLPGGRAPLSIRGFAISAGTQYPDAAYRLLTYLSQQPEIMDAFPARRSLRTQAVAYLSDDPSVFSLVETSIDNGISPADARFSRHLSVVLSKLAQESIVNALNSVQTEILARLAEADQRREGTPLAVMPPPPVVILQPGEIRLRLGVFSFSELPNQSAWDQAIDQFVANSTEVGDVDMEIMFEFAAERLAEQYDCYYVPYNLVTDTNLPHLRSLDPLLTTDPTQPLADYPQGVLSQVQRNGQTWALPINLDPSVVLVDQTALDAAGLPLPNPNWTTNDLETYLGAMQATIPAQARLTFLTSSSESTRVLIASYGGVLFDDQTTPPTVNFTNPNNVTAIQSVLDLVGAKQIVLSIDIMENPDLGVFMVDSLSYSRYRLLRTADAVPNQFQVLPLPRGNQTSGITYTLGAGYISSQTNYVDSCYQLLSAISQNPALITEMPARNSVLANSQLAIVQGEQFTQLYQSISEMLQLPSTIHISSSSDISLASEFDYIWLNKVITTYLKDGGDLNTMLAEAEQLTQDFVTCRSVLTFPQVVTEEAFRVYYTQFRDCGTRIDPSVADQFPSFD